MSKKFFLLAAAVLSVGIQTGCANPHFFPQMRPLFAGLNEEHLSPGAQRSLAEAKADFMLAKHGKTPQYAALAQSVPNSRSKIYVGKGYRLTVVREDNIHPHRSGPAIVVSPSITGGKAYRYDEVDEVAE
jgi:hypothetical protein